MPQTTSIISATLPSIAEMRERRNQLSERELWQRCQSAARLEMRGQRYSSEDRQDCAAQILADGIAALNGAMPTSHDPKHSLGSYCKRSQTIRRSLDRQRDRDIAAAEAEQDSAAWTIDALTPDVDPTVEVSPVDAWNAASKAAERLGFSMTSKPIRALFYGYARDVTGPVVADELAMSPNAYDVACCRGREMVRESYPTAEMFLLALCGDPVWSVDPSTGEPVLTYSVIDDSSEAHTRTHILAEDWRDGTDGGSWPDRPETADDARAACEMRQRPAAPKLAEQNRSKAHRQISPLQAEADALRNLGLALSR
jgi:hypothetical protein